VKLMFNILFETIFFFLFALIGLFAAFLTVTVTKLVHSAVCLMIVLTISAAFYLLLGAEFLAGIQMLLYVGGVLILIVFAIMVTSGNELNQESPTAGRKLAAAAVSIMFFLTCVYVFSDDFFKTNKQLLLKDEISSVGHSFLNYGGDGQIISFELISIILLAALIGGIVIGRKDDVEESK